MDSQQSRDRKETVDEQRDSTGFLVAEYQRFANLFSQNEEAGDKRVNFFITRITAMIAALAALVEVSKRRDSLDEVALRWIAVFALLLLLIFGVLTLLRIIKRNRVSDEYKGFMDAIRDHFQEWDDRLENYQPFGKSGKSKRRRLGTGGLAETVVTLNSVIVAALCALLATPCAKAITIGIFCAVSFVVAWGTQFVYLWYCNRERGTKADGSKSPGD